MLVKSSIKGLLYGATLAICGFIGLFGAIISEGIGVSGAYSMMKFLSIFFVIAGLVMAGFYTFVQDEI